MTANRRFAVNSYAYILSHRAEDFLRHFAAEGYDAFELMLFPGHLWPAELDAAARQALRRFTAAESLRVITLNMPNIDINIGAATAEMRAYSLERIAEALELAGDLGVATVLIGPGKPNPLFPLPAETMMGHLFAAFDRLAPVAARAGTTIALENLPIAFLPDAESMMAALERYGNRDIGIVYDLANAVFAGDPPAAGLRRVKDRLRLVHLSDTTREVYRHDPVGRGIVPFAEMPPVLAEIGYKEPAMLEIISNDPDRDIAESADKLAGMGFVRPRP